MVTYRKVQLLISKIQSIEQDPSTITGRIVKPPQTERRVAEQEARVESSESGASGGGFEDHK